MNHGVRAVGRRQVVVDPTHDPRQVQNPQYHQHEPDRQLHSQTDARRDDDAEQNNGRTHHKDCQRMTESPEGTDQCRVLHALLPAYDGGNGNNVIRVGGVPHSKKKAQDDNREERNHKDV